MRYLSVILTVLTWSMPVFAWEKEDLNGKSPQEIMEYYALSGELSAMSGSNSYILNSNAAHDAHHIQLRSPSTGSGFILNSNAAHDTHHVGLRGGLTQEDRSLVPPGETLYECDSSQLKEGTTCRSIGTVK